MGSALKSRCAFVYAGIGTQWKTMGADLLKEEPVFRDAVESCDREFAKFSSWSIIEEISRSATSSCIDDLLIAHPCNVAIQIGLTTLLQEWHLVPHGVVGHSSGEVAAACTAGILSLKDAMLLTWCHCKLMANVIGKGVLVHIGLPVSEVRQLLKAESDSIWVAAVNSPSATVVTGASELLIPLIRRLEQQKIFCRILKIDIPYHCPAVDPFISEFHSGIRKLMPGKAKMPIYSTLRGGIAGPDDFGAEYWPEHISREVKFSQTVAVMLADGYRTFIEISPHGVLSGAIDECVIGFKGLRSNLPASSVMAIPTLKRFTDAKVALSDSLSLLAATDRLDPEWLPSDIGTALLEKAESITQPERAISIAGGEVMKTVPQNLTTVSFTDLIQEALNSVTHGRVKAPLNSSVGFLEMGLTSQHALRMAHYLSTVFGENLPATLIFDHPNITALTDFLTSKFVNVQGDQFNLDDVDAKSGNSHISVTEPPLLGQDQRDAIAVIGMACRFPGSANTPAKFQELLLKGECAIKPLPLSRWNSELWLDSDPDVPGKAYSQAGGFLDETHIFDLDAPFFRISPKEALSLDPQQRLLLETVWESLEDAGISPSAFSGERVGVYVGISTLDYMGAHLWSPNSELIDGYAATGSMSSAAAGRISYLLNLRGPNFALDTACSSALTALDSACQALRSGSVSSAIVAGVNAIVHPHLFVYFSKLGALSPSGRCRTFDAAADGYVRGEGAGAIVLKPLAKAVADQDRILALIRGTAVNHDGASSSFTAPNGPAQQEVIRLALQNAGVSPLDVNYVEAHGTGTRLGDPVEMQALGAVYGEGRPKDRPLWVGSVKANIGHLEAASGMASLIKTILILNSGIILPQAGFDTPNPLIPWEELPVAIPTEPTLFGEDNRERIAGVSAFGFSGTNVHVILSQPPTALPDRPLMADHADEKPLKIAPSEYLLTISARTPDALAAYCCDYIEFLEKMDDDPHSLADMCYTAHVGRTVFDYSCSVKGGRREDFIAALERIVSDSKSLTRLSSALQPPALAPLDAITPNGKRVSIPTYPFQRKRFWMNPVASNQINDQINQASSISDKSDHDSAEESQDVVLYNTKFDRESPTFIPEHIIYGEPIVPAAAYLSQLFSCFKRIRTGEDLNQHDLTGEELAGKNMRIASQSLPLIIGVGRDIRFTAPMVVRELLSVKLICSKTDQTQREFKILSQTETGQSVTHCEGWLESVTNSEKMAAIPPVAERESITVPDLPIAWPNPDKPFALWVDQFCQTSSQTMSGDQFYSYFKPLGYDLGPGFRRIEKVFCHPGEALCRLNLTPAPATSGYDLYPGFIDAMLQSLIFGTPQILSTLASQARILIPFALDRFEVYATPAGNSAICLVRTRHEADYLQGDIKVFTPEGMLLLSFLGLTVRLTDRATLLKGLVSGLKKGIDGSLKGSSSTLKGSSFTKVSKELPTGEGRLFYNLCWEESADKQIAEDRPLSVTPSMQSVTPSMQSEEFLIFGDQGELGSQIAKLLESAGLTCKVVLQKDLYPSSLSTDEMNRSPVDLNGSTGDCVLSAAIKALIATDHTARPLRVIYLWGCDLTLKDDLSGTKLHQQQLDALRSAMLLIQTLAESGRPGRFYGVTRGAFLIPDAKYVPVQHFQSNNNYRKADYVPELGSTINQSQFPQMDRVQDQDSSDQPALHKEPAPTTAQQTIWGLGKTAALEYPDCFGGLVDLDPLAASSQIDHFVADLLAEEELDQVAYRVGVTSIGDQYVRVLRPRITLFTPRRELCDTQIKSCIPRMQPPLDPDGAYLITGASGGLGLSMARKMIQLGGRRIWLVVRRPPGLKFLQELQVMEASGVKIALVQADVSDQDQLSAALERLPGGVPTLKGVLHLAGVRRDALLPLQTRQGLDAVIAPKAIGAWNLHNIVKGVKLDFFILFSSAASLLGSQGQANYSAANAFLDGLADYRHSLGLPALTIQWGPWAESGMAAEERVVHENLTSLGFAYLSPDQGLTALEALLREYSSSVAVFECDWGVYLNQTGQHHAALFQKLTRGLTSELSTNLAANSLLWQKLAGNSPDQQLKHLLKQLADLAQVVSGIDTPLDLDRPLMEQGFDSLMAVEFRNQLQKLCGLSLPITLLFTYPAVADIALFIQRRSSADKVKKPDETQKSHPEEERQKKLRSEPELQQNHRLKPEAEMPAKHEKPLKAEEKPHSITEQLHSDTVVETNFDYLDQLTPEELNELIARDLEWE